MVSACPRCGISTNSVTPGFFTFASVWGLKFAVAAWNSGAPDAGTAKVS
jgi:hypothetical protein